MRGEVVAACPVCGNELSDAASVDRICAVCGMMIDRSGTHFAVAGKAGLQFTCSPRCTRTFVTLAAVTAVRR